MEVLMKALTLFALIVPAAFAQPANPVVLVVDVENAVQYRSDVADPAKRGTDANLSVAAASRAFTDVLYIGDIVAVNGKPAKGLWTSRQLLMNFSPAPQPGFAISDTTRGTIAECKWEFLDADGRFIGAISDSGLAPHAVSGGVGAFFGVQGQMGAPTPANPNAKPIRVASMSEDPANRRILGGGTNRVAFHLIPQQRPAVEAALHSDFTPVTADKPAHAGETLILVANGLGPLVPGTTPPGAGPFPATPTEVNSPVEATINGFPAAVINNIGWPGETSRYRVDIRVPDGITAGNGIVQLTAAWIPGALFSIPVR